MIDQAIILAAGLGTRMRPLTQTTPKPLIRVNGRALIDYKLDALRAAGVGRVIVNVHYLAEQLESHLAGVDDMEIIISNEREMLMDSGGGISKVLHQFDGKAFFVLNSDTFWHADQPPNLVQLGNEWERVDVDLLMGLVRLEACVGFDGVGDFFMEKQGRLKRRGQAEHAPYVYSGDYIAHPRVFKNMPVKPYSANIVFDAAIKSGRLRGHVLSGLWLHVGTPQSIMEAQRAIALFDG